MSPPVCWKKKKIHGHSLNSKIWWYCIEYTSFVFKRSSPKFKFHVMFFSFLMNYMFFFNHDSFFNHLLNLVFIETLLKEILSLFLLTYFNESFLATNNYQSKSLEGLIHYLFFSFNFCLFICLLLFSNIFTK